MVESGSSPLTVKRTSAIAVSVGGFTLGVLIATLIALVIPDDGGGNSNSATSTVPVQFSVAPPSPRTTQYKSAEGVLGQPVTNGGVTLTVTAVTVLPAVPREDGDVPARIGAKVIRVDTTVENVGQKSMDLTCGYPVTNKIWDSEKRQFDAVESSYEIPGNPGCNDGLQPGFSSPMTYVYEVPEAAKVEFFGFADSDVNYGSDTSYIAISP